MLDFTKELCPDRPLIHPTSQTKNCRFGRYVEIGDHCVLEETEVGDYTYCFGSNDIIYTALGKFNSIATAALIDWRRQNHRVVTGNDVWLGHNAVLMGGVTLGDGAVVGAGAVVTHDVAPYEIVGGVPARHIGWRYPPELIAAMERIRWWDWSHDMLRERLRDFDDAAAFCRKFDPQYKTRARCFQPESNGPLH